ncbi:methyltransferase domain-containing protein [Silvanigrella paludirubra]|uniref:Methyltransferase domain-containing protein n=1 Tax=Silvanigrella paludirubra TaxID=2499159 RepID=A0A6N6VW83_9BACT|nr:class I SAM-dependent methyltransferase [Silvanigrella paludirubra]KAB8037677.1 methyltransferase domain-containing protein [Silvanigrella paludirubra]
MNNYTEKLKEIFTNRYNSQHTPWTHDESLDYTTVFAFNKLTNNLKNKNINILDIGCGNGRHAKYFNNLNYTGIDLVYNDNWSILSKNKKINFIMTSFLEFNAKDNYKYDLILDNGCLHHQSPLYFNNYLKKVRNLMNDKHSIYSLVVWNEQFCEYNIDHEGRYHHFFSSQEISSLLFENFLKVIDIKNIKAKNDIMQLHIMSQIME